MKLVKTAARAANHPHAEPNVIPFIDVLLVLLVIFMVTAPKPTVDLRLDLPNQQSPRQIAIAPIIVDVHEIGAGGAQIFIAEREVPLSALSEAVIASAISADGYLAREDVIDEARVFVRAEQGIAYGNVVAVIDELQHYGFAKVGVFAQTADEA
jgi:biopolymer transport protein ExbD